MTTQKHYRCSSLHNNKILIFWTTVDRSTKVTHVINDHFADVAMFATFIPQVITDLVDQHRVALEDKRNDKTHDYKVILMA